MSYLEEFCQGGIFFSFICMTNNTALQKRGNHDNYSNLVI